MECPFRGELCIEQFLLDSLHFVLGKTMRLHECINVKAVTLV